MIRALFAPLTPAEELAREREQVAKRRPHLSLASTPDPRPDPDMFVWKDPAELWGPMQSRPFPGGRREG